MYYMATDSLILKKIEIQIREILEEKSILVRIWTDDDNTYEIIKEFPLRRDSKNRGERKPAME